MKRYLLLAVLAALFVSCDEMLVEEPKSILNPSQFFNSDAEANGAAMYWFYGRSGTMAYWSALGTDLARPTRGREANYIYHTYRINSANEANIEDLWRRLYRAVGDCNLVISSVTDNPEISEAVRTRVLGEALFLRAQYYYVLTCFWGMYRCG